MSIEQDKQYDAVEDSLLRIYVYDRWFENTLADYQAPNSYTFINIRNEQLSTTSKQTKLLKDEKTGDFYFEAFGEISKSVGIKPISQIEITSNGFIYEDEYTLFAFDFEVIPGDSDKFFTVGKPLDMDEYKIGKQQVYKAQVDPSFVNPDEYLDLANATNQSEVVLEERVVVNMTLTNLNDYWESNSRIVVNLTNSNILEPKIEYQNGKYTKVDTPEATSLSSGATAQKLISSSFPLDKDLDFYFNNGAKIIYTYHTVEEETTILPDEVTYGYDTKDITITSDNYAWERRTFDRHWSVDRFEYNGKDLFPGIDFGGWNQDITYTSSSTPFDVSITVGSDTYTIPKGTFMTLERGTQDSSSPTLYKAQITFHDVRYLREYVRHNEWKHDVPKDYEYEYKGNGVWDKADPSNPDFVKPTNLDFEHYITIPPYISKNDWYEKDLSTGESFITFTVDSSSTTPETYFYDNSQKNIMVDSFDILDKLEKIKFEQGATGDYELGASASDPVTLHLKDETLQAIKDNLFDYFKFEPGITYFNLNQLGANSYAQINFKIEFRFTQNSNRVILQVPIKTIGLQTDAQATTFYDFEKYEQYFETNQNKGVSNASGFSLAVNKSALLSSIVVNGLNADGEYVDILDLNSNETLTPLMVNILEPKGKNIDIYIPWFDTQLTLPTYLMQKFWPTGGASINDLPIQDQSKELIWDMILITRLFNDSLSALPIITSTTNSQYGKINPETIIGFNKLKPTIFSGSNSLVINDGLFKKWIQNNGFNETTQEVILVKGIIASLSNYIASSQAIAGGNLNYVNAYLPWRLRKLGGLNVKTNSSSSSPQVWLEAPTVSSSSPSLTNLSNIKFIFESNYFELIRETYLKPIKPDLSRSKIFLENRTVLPELDDTLTSTLLPYNAGQIDPTSDENRKYSMTLPLYDDLQIKTLFFDDERRGQANYKNTDVVKKTFALPSNYDMPLSADEIQKNIEKYVWDTYGKTPSQFKIIQQPIETKYYSKQNVEYSSLGEWKETLYPNDLYSALGLEPLEVFGTGFGDEFWIKEITPRYNPNRKYSVLNVATPQSDGGVYGFVEKFSKQEIVLTDEMLLKIARVSQKNYANRKASIVRAVPDDDKTVGLNIQGWFKDELRFWNIKFEAQYEYYKYESIIVELELSDGLENFANRQSVFKLKEFDDYIRRMNLLNRYDIPPTADAQIDFISNAEVERISEIDIHSLNAKYFKIKINGVEFEVPSFNKEDNTITRMRVFID